MSKQDIFKFRQLNYEYYLMRAKRAKRRQAVLSVLKWFGQVALCVALYAFLSYVLMLLWNLTIPHLFRNAEQMDYTVALGLLLLINLVAGLIRIGTRSHA